MARGPKCLLAARISILDSFTKEYKVAPWNFGGPSRHQPGVTQMNHPHARGHVTLVGAGPGDPELLTLRALRTLQRADVVLFDNLVPDEIVSLAEGALLVDVGKIPGGKRTRQGEINRLLAHYADLGHHVVRLKGGDPFVFGRGGEEAMYLRERGIAVTTVPGISSCIAAPASAGIPVTHRNVATSFTVITGQAAAGASEELEKSWARAAQLGGTLVFLMGVRAMKRIIAALERGGLPASTPAALVQCGTRDDQRTLTSTLSRIVDDAAAANIASPAVFVIGDVVALQPAIAGEIGASATSTNEWATSAAAAKPARHAAHS